jgi:dienelactone hydrolase
MRYFLNIAMERVVMSRYLSRRLGWIAALVLAIAPAAQAQSTAGSVLEPSARNLDLTWENASVALPPSLAGGAVWQGKLAGMKPPSGTGRSPAVILMHGSSGNAAFIKDYQKWLAESLNLASIAPDSLAIPDRLTYTSPIDKPTYERVHALRLAELANALSQASLLPWIDPRRIIVIGTSEGAVPVARLSDDRPMGRVIYAWSCERNYFVEEPRTAIPKETPVLAVIAVKDPYFSPENAWNKDVKVAGSCSAALKDHSAATVVTISTDKHTIMNFAEVQDLTRSFLTRLLSNAK